MGCSSAACAVSADAFGAVGAGTTATAAVSRLLGVSAPAPASAVTAERSGALGVSTPTSVARPRRRRDQGRQTLDQFERGQHQADAAARARLDALIDQVLGIDFTQPFQRKGRSGAIAQQSLQALAVGCFDAHAGIERETPAVIHVPIAARLRAQALRGGRERSTDGGAPGPESRRWFRDRCPGLHESARRLRHRPRK